MISLWMRSSRMPFLRGLGTGCSISMVGPSVRCPRRYRNSALLPSARTSGPVPFADSCPWCGRLRLQHSLSVLPDHPQREGVDRGLVGNGCDVQRRREFIVGESVFQNQLTLAAQAQRRSPSRRIRWWIWCRNRQVIRRSGVQIAERTQVPRLLAQSKVDPGLDPLRCTLGRLHGSQSRTSFLPPTTSRRGALST